MNINQRGIAHILLTIFLLVGIGLGVYLIGQKTQLSPFASQLISDSSMPTALPNATTPPVIGGSNFDVYKSIPYCLAEGKISRIHLHWSTVGGAQLYKVFRTDPAGNRTLIYENNWYAFNDEKVQGGKKYDYQIEAIVGINIVKGNTISITALTCVAPLPVKIMPLGDSITHGVLDRSDPNNVEAGYRYFLYKKLKDNGYSVDFVGSLRGGPADLDDKDHEGHKGWGIGFYTVPNPIPSIARLIDTWLINHKPDIILMMLGTNDMVEPSVQPDLLSAPDRLNSLIDKIIATSPNTHIIISTIPPFASQDVNVNRIDPYNEGLIRIINNKRSEGKKVSLVDIRNLIIPATDLVDGVHPNNIGYEKIANSFYNELVKLLSNGISSPAPVKSPIPTPSSTPVVKPSIAISPGRSTVGARATITWNNITGIQKSHWVGLYSAGVANNQFTTWYYLSGSGTCAPKLSGTAPSSSGNCIITLPSQAGSYIIKVFKEASFNPIAIGNTIIVN